MSTAGIALPGLELRCLAAAGGTLPVGEEGELVMRGPGVFIGYFGQQDLYESLITDDGFFSHRRSRAGSTPTGMCASPAD